MLCSGVVTAGRKMKGWCTMKQLPGDKFRTNVLRLFSWNAYRKEPWKTQVVAYGDDFDLAQMPYAEFVVPRGTIAGARRECGSVTRQRTEFFSRAHELEFVGFLTFTGQRDIDGRTVPRVCCAHFVDDKGNDYYINKRFHEVFKPLPFMHYYLNDHIITYASEDDTAPAWGSVCRWVPYGWMNEFLGNKPQKK